MAHKTLQAATPMDGQMGAQTQKAIPAGATETTQIGLAAPILSALSVYSMDNDPGKPYSALNKNGIIVLCSMGLTFVILRAYLHFSPDTDLNIGRYNIHHIFTDRKSTRLNSSHSQISYA